MSRNTASRKTCEKYTACRDSDKRMPTELQRGKVSPYWTHFPEHGKYEREDNILYHLSSLNAEAVTKWMEKL